MMASSNDYMYIIFPCLTTYLMLTMCFLCNKKKQSAKKHSAENIKQQSYSRKQQKSIPKKAYNKKSFTMIAEKRTAEKHYPEKLIFWITSPWQVCFKKVVSVSDIFLRRGKVLEMQERFCKLLGKILEFWKRFHLRKKWERC